MTRPASQPNSLPRRRLRLPPRFWRLLLLALLLGSVTTEGLPSENAFQLELAALTANRRFNWLTWETEAMLEEAGRWLQGQPVMTNLGSDQTKQVIISFIERQQQIFGREDEIEAGYARPEGDSPPLPGLERKLAALYDQQRASASQAERILAAQVAAVLVEEGFGQKGQVWPPVTFRFNNLPTYLIISPRTEIRQLPGVYLWPDLPEGERIDLEARVEARTKVSALVTDVGGIGSWPTLVADPVSLRSTLDVIAHEWSHTYLMLYPLGLHYSDSQDLTTMNETVASIVGGEVAELVIARFYPELRPPPPSLPARVETAPEQKSIREDFNGAMRRIRLHVDDLLAQGRVDAAEVYMESERQKLVEQGYVLRKLNQAYFAFYGSYATSPDAVDPIGPWLRQLRKQSPSLKAFVDQVAPMTGRDDLLKALGLGGK